ncbi:MAG: GPR endopeptidase [Clostridia bacterium]|nr:GPR endopeptidase [Clostridia bacterium]
MVNLCGTYITIDIKKLKIATEEEIEEASNVLAEELKGLVNLHVQSSEDVLVVGLGNEYVTPDSLRT